MSPSPSHPPLSDNAHFANAHFANAHFANAIDGSLR